MKTLTIYKRNILEKAGFKKYPYKKVEQISIFYENQEIKNHYEDINNPRLKIKFNKVLETRSIKELKSYIEKLGKSYSDIFQKEVLTKNIMV